MPKQGWRFLATLTPEMAPGKWNHIEKSTRSYWPRGRRLAEQIGATTLILFTASFLLFGTCGLV